MITNTSLKLKDASTQIKIALDNIEDEDIFRSCVNSFISNSRSVTMLMEKESSKNKNIKAWYKSKMEVLGEEPLFKYFNKQRVFTIHKGVIKPEKKSYKTSNMKVYFNTQSNEHTASIEVPSHSGGIPIGINDVINLTEDGHVWGWYFTDIQDILPGDSGNVPNLCERYFVELKSLVIEWLELKANK